MIWILSLYDIIAHLCPHQESNLDFLLRTELFYPLNYGGDRESVTYFRGKNKSDIVNAMTPEEKSLLERTYKLTEENHQMLRSIRRSNRLSIVMRVAYWAIILILSFGAYYLIQPWITSMLGIIGNSQGGIEGNMQAAQDAANQLKDLMK